MGNRTTVIHLKGFVEISHKFDSPEVFCPAGELAYGSILPSMNSNELKTVYAPGSPSKQSWSSKGGFQLRGKPGYMFTLSTPALVEEKSRRVWSLPSLRRLPLSFITHLPLGWTSAILILNLQIFRGKIEVRKVRKPPVPYA